MKKKHIDILLAVTTILLTVFFEIMNVYSDVKPLSVLFAVVIMIIISEIVGLLIFLLSNRFLANLFLEKNQTTELSSFLLLYYLCTKIYAYTLITTGTYNNLLLLLNPSHLIMIFFFRRKYKINSKKFTPYFLTFYLFNSVFGLVVNLIGDSK